MRLELLARKNPVDSLKDGGQRGGVRAASLTLHNALLVSQVALALVLVISAGLLTRTFFRMLGANGGFNPERMLTFQLSLPAGKYPDQDHIAIRMMMSLEEKTPLTRA